jgi:hypothetical protein
MSSEYPDTPQVRKDTVGAGVGISFLLVILFQVATPFLGFLVVELLPFEPSGGEEGIWVLIGWFSLGWTAPFYLLPFAFIQRRKSRPLRAKGVMMVAGILFMLTSLCNAGFWGGL